MTDVLAAVGQLDVLVNNAGVIQTGPVELATIDDFQESLEIHFWAPLHLIRRPCRTSRRRRTHHQYFFHRRTHRRAAPDSVRVGKFALAALSDGLHSELAKDGISVLTATPGLMRTGSHRNVKVRGRHEAEARLFALSTASSLTSMDVGRAAAEIIDASRHRRARVTPGIQARSAQIADVLAPELTAAIVAFVARWLPRPGDASDADRAVWSRDLDFGWMTSLFPSAAAARMNQPLAADEA